MTRLKGAAIAIKRHITSWLEKLLLERLRRESLNLLHRTLISTRADVARWDVDYPHLKKRTRGERIWKRCSC